MPTPNLELIIPLVAGYLLDLLLGDPRGLPHPVVGFGKWIGLCERHLNHGKHLSAKGTWVGILLPVSVFAGCYLLARGAGIVGPWLFYPVATLAVFFALANKSLIQEGAAVIHALETEGLEAGRRRLSWIVGRDTANLSSRQIYTAVLETLSENLSDGVIAPLFYYAIGGFPAMLTYKMINTLDSMIGYKNEKYLKFGSFSARLDDVANFIPARLTAFFIALVARSPRALRFLFRYGHHHASPNSGYPEAALAGALDCRFGGPNSYFGTRLEKPYLGTTDRELSMADFQTAAQINHRVTLLSVGLICLLFLF